eukprot:3235029-Amphidinium_carterae.1
MPLECGLQGTVLNLPTPNTCASVRHITFAPGWNDWNKRFVQLPGCLRVALTRSSIETSNRVQHTTSAAFGETLSQSKHALRALHPYAPLLPEPKWPESREPIVCRHADLISDTGDRPAFSGCSFPRYNIKAPRVAIGSTHMAACHKYFVGAHAEWHLLFRFAF